ncbi:MAG: hypothetical protein HKN76_13325 [Saprospiraceae bacterium]|nr:hypothetical protein [Saprospiraceae bacterium]
MVFRTYLIVQLLLTALISFAKISSKALHWQNNCYPTVHYQAPSTYYINPGKDIYVKMVVANSPHCVSYVDLYLGKQFIGRDNTSPYEWCTPNSTDHAPLRNMAIGVYSLSAVVKYASGKKKIMSRKFEIKSPYANANQFAWMEKIKRMQPNHQISEYRSGSLVMFKIHSCYTRSSDILWYDKHGRILASDATSRQRIQAARFVKHWFRPCR